MLLGTALGKRDALLDFLHFPLITRNIYNAAEIIVKDIMEQEKLHNIHDCAPSSTKLLVAPLQVHMLFQSRAAAIWNRTSVGLCTACELEVARPGVWLMRGRNTADTRHLIIFVVCVQTSSQDRQLFTRSYPYYCTRVDLPLIYPRLNILSYLMILDVRSLSCCFSFTPL